MALASSVAVVLDTMAEMNRSRDKYPDSVKGRSCSLREQKPFWKKWEGVGGGGLQA